MWRRLRAIWVLHWTMLRNWVRAFAGDPQRAFPGHGQLKPEQAEIEEH